jgi:hypothetical protein
MTDGPPSVPWTEFTSDPREPGSATLRASDRDREVVLGVLGDAYADGRLTRDEHDERLEATTATRTLGELPALIADLVPLAPPARSGDLARATPDELQRRAVQRWEAQRRQALTGFLVPTVICWVVWIAVALQRDAHGVFPWPLFVMLGTGMNVARVMLHREDIVTEEHRRLEKKQRKALGRGSAQGRIEGPDAG